MGKQTFRRKGRLHDLWLSFTLKQKIWTFTGAVVLTILLFLLLGVLTVNFALYGFGGILDDNARSYALLAAIEEESDAFSAYARSRTEEDKKLYDLACAKTAKSVEALPFDYQLIGPDRYAKTWSIINAYAGYEEERDRIFEMQDRDSSYVSNLYRIYRMQGYLDTYARRLVQATLQDGSEAYLSRVPFLHQFPYLILGVSAVIITIILYLSTKMRKSLVMPVERLAHVSRKIARNDYSGDDIYVENKDEMGELVQAFNKMKHATVGYITTLEEKYEISELLHKEEMERVEIGRTLEATRMEVLKSQINPHFLFNTLNMISCMAKLENAHTTERMITSLGNLFRYNLKTKEAEVCLAKELTIVDDYMFIQQMRFGNRIQFRKTILVNDHEVMIPSFSLQPLIENAIIHGISGKEQGGKIHLRIWEKENALTISIADSGAGMSKERLVELETACKGEKIARLGIGLDNIYKRLQMMYETADMKVYSKAGAGTIVRIRIVQKKEGEDVQTIDCG